MVHTGSQVNHGFKSLIILSPSATPLSLVLGLQGAIICLDIYIKSRHAYLKILLHFVAFFHVASLFSIGVDNEKVGVDN